MAEGGSAALSQAFPDASQLTRVFAAHQRVLLAHCYRFLRDVAAAEDATHDIFLKLLARPVTWPTSPRELRPWLIRIATNHCLNEVRNGVRRTRLLSATLVEESTQEEARLVTRDSLAHLLSDLPSRTRQVVELTYVDGLTQDEIAAALGVSRRTVVSDLLDARTRASSP